MLDVTAIENVVGRVEMKGTIGGEKLGFIHQSNNAARTTFLCTNDGDEGYKEDDQKFSIVMHCLH